MSDNATWIIVIATITLGAVAPIVHYNEKAQNTQRLCMAAGGNWETRENSSGIGCRFPVKGKP